MNFPPDSPTDLEVLAAVQGNWNLEIDVVTYFPAGFGAHHWRAMRRGAPVAFITLDSIDHPDDHENLERAYGSASAIAQTGFGGVIAPIPNFQGEFTVPVRNGLLSMTPWIHAVTPSPTDAEERVHLDQTIDLLRELHALPVPPMLPHWRPQIAEGFAAVLVRLLNSTWTSGPFGESARELIKSSQGQILLTLNRFIELTQLALVNELRWVPTHGEPHFANQMIANDQIRFIDWETFRLAPVERDVVGIPESAWEAFSPDTRMIELFQLEWTLCEIDAYAIWFSNPHSGNQDDIDAYAKLREELNKL